MTTATTKKPTAATPAIRNEDEDVLELVVRMLKQHLSELGISADLEAPLRHARQQLGGMSHYVRSGRAEVRDERARAMLIGLVHGGKSATQVARELGIPKTTAHRLKSAVLSAAK